MINYILLESFSLKWWRINAKSLSNHCCCCLALISLVNPVSFVVFSNPYVKLFHKVLVFLRHYLRFVCLRICDPKCIVSANVI